MSFSLQGQEKHYTHPPTCRRKGQFAFSSIEGHGDHYYTTHYTTSCYTEAPKYCTKAPDYCSTTYAALSYYTESPLYYSSPSYTTKGSITTPMLRSTTPLRQLLLRYSTPKCLSAVPRALIFTPPRHRSTTATYAAPAHYTEAPQHYTTKALEYYTTTYHVNNGVVLLLGVVSLMVGSTTGVPMSPGYGGYQSTTLPCRLTIKHQLPLLQLTTLRLSSATPPRLQITTPQLMLPQATTLNARSIFSRATLPKGRGSQVLHHKGIGVQKRSNTTQNHGTLWRCAIVNVATVMSGSTTGVPISPGYGGLEHSTTTEVLKCYTTKVPKHYTTTYAAPMLLRRSTEVFFFPELHYPHHAAY
ncbi:LOW QUALITY PROTEIN: hypothetical protein DAPPUDRAFT_237487 [Daphnia pulex]|uniref:Uncharacterized protein n=1 Tax=Daphnia pulex TaxID=6669 RepID=E9G3Z7_DAPPU|nr:LOW QUALITY PROTEIN: hypothetical protein DAPPUDRAFT_237487 [Daphnia pulex]|eukprot:EFX85859.1 LOW QUALITY PROTEIN: hypothetical protein DAPPUDRAFT_237487 [Daphnia pulex]